MKQLLLKHKLIIMGALIFMCSCLSVSALTKRALLIGISDYSKEYSWSHINSTNDIDIIKKVLKGFKITELRNSEATYNNIINELSVLIKNSKEGDVVYIHFSGHGQPVEDLNGDETDGWDESFVPFDAGQIYGENGYTGGKHLLDDTFNTYLSSLRKKLGSKGMLYVVIDACHAGTMRRGDEDNNTEISDAPIRGTNQGFSKNKFYRPKKEQIQSHYLVPSEAGLSDIIILEACGSNQKNQEIKISDKYYGPLSYSVYKTIKAKGLTKTKEWQNLVSQNMTSLLSKSMTNQKMVVESTIK